MAQEEGSSSVTSSPFQLFSWIPGIGSPYPLLREMNSEERGLNLINLIITCTNYVAANSAEADVGLDYISNLASPDGEPMQRIAAYFNEALASRMLKGRPGLHRALYSTRIASVNEDILVRKLFFELCPFLKLAYVITNQAIVEAMEEEKMVHIIDLHSFEPAQWINLLQTFSGRPGGPPHLRITGIHEQREVLNQMSQLLTDEAEKLDIPFQFNPVVSKLEDIELENLPLKMGEALAVSSVLQLHTLLATNDDISRNSPLASRPLTSSQLQKALHLDRRTLGEWLRTDSVSIFSPSPDSMSSSLSTLSLTSSPKMESFLRGLKPKLVVVTEQESDHNGNSLMERVMRALNFYATLFDCLESTMSRESMKRRMLEKKLFGEEIKNIIACEGNERKERHEKLEKWVLRLELAGFGRVPLSFHSRLQASSLLHKFNDGIHNYVVREESDCLSICWKDRPLFSVSAWRFRR